LPDNKPGKNPSATPAAQLYRAADLSALTFETTDDLEAVDGLIGQQRALDAIRFGAGIDRPGFNLFAVGRTEARMQEAVETILKGAAAGRPTPSDLGLCQQLLGCAPSGCHRPPGRAGAEVPRSNARPDR